MSDAIETFFEAWAEQDDAKREAALAGTLGDTIFYVDPRTEAPLTEPAAVTDYVGQFSKMAPGMPVTVTSQTKTLNFVRATVLFGTREQGQLGQYTIDLDDAGKMIRLVGFVGAGE